MTITGIMMIMDLLPSGQAAIEAFDRRPWSPSSTSAYFLSNITKIPHGGYWSLIIAASRSA